MIGFYHEYEKNGCFSNWYHAEFDYAGKHFINSEQFMMYHKVLMFQRYDLADQIMNTDDPAKCKKIAGQKFPEFDSDLWERTCHTIVKRGVKAKFAQNQYILDRLLNTGNDLLAECSPYDKKWGIGIDIKDPAHQEIAKWKGMNLLGRILMEVREELRQEILCSPDGKIQYVDALNMEPITEWKMTAGELKRIPPFYSVIHAYSETIKTHQMKEAFYHQCSLHEWETAMRNNINGGLPVIGFYEMKQDVYDTSRRLSIVDPQRQKRLAFCEKYIPLLQIVESDEIIKQTYLKCPPYISGQKHQDLFSALYYQFMEEAYKSDIVIHNYGDLIEEGGISEWVAEPTEKQLQSLDAKHVLACIAWHFRSDHFANGSMIFHSIKYGHMLRMLKIYVEKERIER